LCKDSIIIFDAYLLAEFVWIYPCFEGL